jgi:signal transduction histidine kinase/ActR/RegA family two-component response regulator
MPDHPDALLQAMHLQDRPAMRAALRAHLHDDVPFQVECRLQEKNGGWRWFLLTGMALRDEQGKAWRMAGSLIDISERKESEILLQQSNRAKDEFLATLAHELRNPLAPLRTGVQILKRPQAPAPTVQRTLDTMDRQLTHMVRLIDDLLDISRINSGKIRLELQAVSLRGVLQTAVELARPALEASRHVLAVQLPEADITLQGDETRLAQTFGNLLNNAAKYTPAGGRVRLAARREGNEAVVEVQDSGIGIPADMLEKVFSLFAQVDTGPRQASGLGIGLFLVRTLVEMHGGTVQAASAGPTQGSTFTVRLPCAAVAPTGAPVAGGVAATDSNGAGTPLRVLVVDDNVDAAETMATFLQMLGMETRCVHDGPPAIPAALEFRPDIVLLDIGLPTLDGYQVARALRAQPAVADTVLIALTGWGSEQDRRRAQDAGFDHHLTKPVDLAQLEAVVRRMGAKAARPAA